MHTSHTVQNTLPADFLTEIQGIDYTSPVTKINGTHAAACGTQLCPCAVAVNRLPTFSCMPGDAIQPHHQTTAHLNCESISVVNDAYLDSVRGKWSRRYTRAHTSCAHNSLQANYRDDDTFGGGCVAGTAGLARRALIHPIHTVSSSQRPYLGRGDTHGIRENG